MLFSKIKMSSLPPTWSLTLPWSLTLLIFLIKAVEAGTISSNTSTAMLISDGEIGHAITQEKNIPSVVIHHHHQHGFNSSSITLSATTCEHLYGFFPCSENAAGHLFQAVVYQYLMGIGGQLVADGSKQLFTLLGTGVFGATLFRILLNFPRLIFVIMSAALSTEAEAQQQVAMSIAIYAGSTIFILTIVWGMILIFARRDLSENSTRGVESISTPLLDNQNGGSQNSKPLEDKDIISQLKETGVTIDEKTSKTAGILLLSVIPFVVAWIAILLTSSNPSQSHLVILITLIASFASMLSYFIYQLWDPWMQERSLEYSKYENLLTGFLRYVQKQTKGKLVDERGQPNIPAIGRLFSENDKNDDKSLTLQEIQKLMDKIQTGEVQVDKDYAVSQVLQVFDLDRDGRISEPEFVEGSKKWIEEANKLEANADRKQSINEFINTFTKKKRDELIEIEGLMVEVMKQVRSKALEVKSVLLNDDGSPNIEGIQTVFKQFVSGGEDNSISHSELKQLIQSLKFGDGQLNPEETVIKVMKGLDQDDDDKIDVGEFVNAVRANWLAESDVQGNQGAANNPSIKDDKGVCWDEADKLLFNCQQTGSIKEKLQLAWTYAQPILQIIWGVAMLTLIARGLISSIISFSFAVGIDSFFISYIILPVIMNLRVVMSAIFPATQKGTRTASLTFSELYGDLITNNLIGLTTVLGIVYAKNLPWDYSAEMLVIIVVSGVVGFFAFFTTTYPLWTCIVAFFLYLLSFALYCVVHYVWGWN